MSRMVCITSINVLLGARKVYNIHLIYLLFILDIK